jgi:hypothetical protein
MSFCNRARIAEMMFGAIPIFSVPVYFTDESREKTASGKLLFICESLWMKIIRRFGANYIGAGAIRQIEGTWVRIPPSRLQIK